MREGLSIRSRIAGKEYFLVRDADVLRSARSNGYCQLGLGEAERVVGESIHDDAYALRKYAFDAGFLEYGIARLTDDDLRQRILDGIEHGGLHVVQIDPTARAEGKPFSTDLLLCQQIETFARGPLSLRGELYQLVVGDDVQHAGDSFEVVRRTEADKVLGELADGKAGSRALAGLLADARKRLSPDWRAPLRPDGIVLLRRSRAVSGSASAEGQVYSPSELRRQFDPAPADDSPQADGDQIPYQSIRQDEQAQVLMDASQSGIPFCEECQKAQSR